MYFSLIVTFLLFLVITITAVQNSMPLEFKFFTWHFQMSITALIFCSALVGGVIVAVLTLPKLVKKSLDARKMNREINRLKKSNAAFGPRPDGGSDLD